jgi:hypothetical protein
MAERFDNLDNADQFGFGKQLDKRRSGINKPRGSDVSESPSTDGNTAGIPSRAFTLDNLLSGDTYTATTQVLPVVSASTELSLNYDIAQNLAFFGSVYTRVSIAVDTVQDGYPNGIIILQIISGTP